MMRFVRSGLIMMWGFFFVFSSKDQIDRKLPVTGYEMLEAGDLPCQPLWSSGRGLGSSMGHWLLFPLGLPVWPC